MPIINLVPKTRQIEDLIDGLMPQLRAHRSLGGGAARRAAVGCDREPLGLSLSQRRPQVGQCGALP